MPTGLKRTITFAAIILGFFMALLDSTIVNVAMPEMTKYFGSQVDDTSWVVNGYNLAFAVFLITASRLADQFGRKRLFLIGVFLFVTTSILAGMSQSLEMLIFFRVLQGLAGAIVVPVTIPLATQLFPPRMHGIIIGVWGAVSGLAAASGPTLGGLLTDAVGWPSIFYVNVPIGIVCLILSFVLLKESNDPSASKSIDWLGMLTLSAAMFSLTYAMIQVNDWGWSSPKLIGFMSSFVLFSVLFVWVERKVSEPMLPLWLMRVMPFVWASLTLLVLGAGIMTSTFLMSFFLTGLMGKTVLQAGVIISAMPLASMVVSASVGALSNRLGSRYFVASGMALMSISIYSYGSLTPDSALFSLIWRLALTGVALGLSMAPVMGSVVRNVPQEKVGIASGITNMTRAIGAVLGVAILVTALNSSMSVFAADSKKNIEAWVQQDQTLLPETKQSLLEGIAAVASRQAAETNAVQGVYRKLEEIKAKKLSETPEKDREQVASAFETQKKALESLLPRIGEEMKRASASAFQRTFHIGALILVAGIVFGLFSDRKKERGQEEENPVPSPSVIH